MEKLNRIIENYPHELKLLLVCCGSERWKVEDLLPFIDWELFFQWVKRHRVNPTIYRYIKNNNTAIPNNVSKKIEQSQQKISKRALLLTSELIRIGKLLDENNIRWYTVKGPMLGLIQFNNISCRDYRDIDIVVEQNKINETIWLFEKEGYSSILNLNLEKLLLINHNIELKNKEKNTKFELHWKLFASNIISQIFIFDKSTVTKQFLQDHSINVPENIFHISYIYLHSAIHQWRELQWLNDCRNNENIIENKVILEFFDKNKIMPVLNIYNTINRLLYYKQEPNKEFLDDKMAIPCIKAIGSLESTIWDKIKKTNYLAYLSDNSGFKNEFLNLRFKRLFSNPAKR